MVILFQFQHLIKVKDTLEALQFIAFSNRCNWNGVCIGITGSAGKTTVKELCHHIVSTTYSSHKNFGNFNNHIGLPITLIDLNESHKYLIAEIGMNQPGEIKFLTNFSYYFQLSIQFLYFIYCNTIHVVFLLLDSTQFNP